MSDATRECGARSRPSVALRMGAYCTACVMALALLCAWSAHRGVWRSTAEAFGDQARHVLKFTRQALQQNIEDQPRVLLHTYYEAEVSRGMFDQIALVIQDRVVIAHSLDWEGLDARFLLGEPSEATAAPSQEAGGVVVRHNRESDRLQGTAILAFGEESALVRLFVSRANASISGAAWARFWSVLGIGMLLAGGAGAATFFCFREAMLAPLARLERRISTRGLETELDAGGLGELFGLARVLEAATGRLLQQESNKLGTVQEALDKSEIERELGTGLLQHLVRDLRGSMSAIMGYSELLISRDSKPHDRINHVRAVQHEARRIAHLVREIQELLSSTEASGITPGQDRQKYVKRLRALIDRLADGESPVLNIPATAARREPRKAETTEAEDEDRSGGSESERPATKTRLTGSILLFGRNDEIVQSLQAELRDIGLGAVWVPDVAALHAEITNGSYDVVMVNLSGRDRSSAEESSAVVRNLFGERPVVAVLPAAARGSGNRYMHIGFDDYIYSPISRQGILTVVAKFLGFADTEAALPPQPAEDHATSDEALGEQKK